MQNETLSSDELTRPLESTQTEEHLRHDENKQDNPEILASGANRD